MYSKILIPIKLTVDFDLFMGNLSEIKGLGIQEIHLVNVLQAKEPNSIQLLQDLERGALQRQEKIWTEKGMKVITHSPSGGFHQEINRIAEEENIDLIVTCSLAGSLMDTLVIDPRGDSLIRNARYPLLTFSCQIAGEEKAVKFPIRGGNLFKKILFPTDFSDNAEYALDTTVKNIVNQTGASVSLLHVQEHKRIYPHLTSRLEEFNLVDEERLNRIKKELLESGASNVDYKILYGHAALIILEEIAKTKPTLIVMGNQGRGRIHEVFVGSVAHHVVRQSSLPVLLIPWYEKQSNTIKK